MDAAAGALGGGMADETWRVGGAAGTTELWSPTASSSSASSSPRIRTRPAAPGRNPRSVTVSIAALAYDLKNPSA